MDEVMVLNANPLIHIRFDGRSFDLPQADLDIGILSSDNEIRNAVAAHLDVPPVKLQRFAVDKNQQTQGITLRPEAVFGSKKI